MPELLSYSGFTFIIKKASRFTCKYTKGQNFIEERSIEFRESLTPLSMEKLETEIMNSLRPASCGKICYTLEKGFLMPYPVVHVLFFLFCVGAVAIFALTGPLFRKELSFKDTRKLLVLVFVGSICTLLPDIPAVYNMMVNGTLDHSSIGPIPTHSFLFSSAAILFGMFVGYIAYGKLSKSVYMAIFAGSAFLTHLLLDDITEGGCPYLYPLYNRPISVFSIMDTGFVEAGSLFHYLTISFVSVFCVFIVVSMALFTLNKFGLEFSYRAEK